MFVALMACLFTVSLLVAATGLGVFISCLGFTPVQGVILLYSPVGRPKDLWAVVVRYTEL